MCAGTKGSATFKLLLIVESACSSFALHGRAAWCADRCRINAFGSTTIWSNCSHSILEQSGMWTWFLNHVTGCHGCQNLEFSEISYCSMSIFCPPHCYKSFIIHASDWIRSMTPLLCFWETGVTLPFLLVPSPRRSALERHKKQDPGDLLLDLVNVCSKLLTISFI